MMLIEPSNIIFSGIKAIFTTKTFNDIENIASRLNIPSKNIFLPIQKHTNLVHVLKSDIKPVIADAVVTNKKGLLIGIQVADCVPILIYDKGKEVIGAVHAGWRGTAGEILKNAIRVMQEGFSSLSKDILIAIGPCIKGCCYEVGDDIKDIIQNITGKGTYYHKKNGKYFIDLSSANKLQALSMGISEDNIWQSEECTYCNPERFYSYRYAGGTTGRQGAFIGMW